MIWLFARAFAGECSGALETPPEAMQVAWVSRLGVSAGRDQYLPVVRASELRKLAESVGRDPARSLQALGLLGKKQAMTQSWKVTIFDVKRDQVCRPVDAPEGSTRDGVAVCPYAEQDKGPGIHPQGWSGCGWLLDSQGGKRGLDLFRVPWSVASARGFCVLPWSRFVSEA